MTIKREMPDYKADFESLSLAVYALTELMRSGISDPMRSLSNEDRMTIERAAFLHWDGVPMKAPTSHTQREPL